MTATFAASVDLVRNVVTLGAMEVALQPAANPGWFCLPDGGAVRAITFGERSAAVTSALAQDDPRAGLLTELRKIALDGEAQAIADAVLLVLAGGAEEAPSFAECIEAVCRAHGLDWQSAQEMSAMEVDRWTARLAVGRNEARQADSGWTRFEFRAPAEVPDVSGICVELAARLLARGASPGETAPPERTTGKTPRLRVRSLPSALPGLQSAIAEAVPSVAIGTAAATKMSLVHTRIESGPAAAPAFTAFELAAATPEESGRDTSFEDTQTSTAPLRPTSPQPENRPAQAIQARAHLVPVVRQVDAARAEVSASVHQRKTFAEPALAPVKTSGVAVPKLEVAPQMELAAISATSSAHEARLVTPHFEQHDWLHELATALADECDLRGLNA